MEDFASAVPGISDSLSPPPGPPDIRNWFSSYVYESLPFSTIGFSGDSFVKETENEVVRFSMVEAEENVGVAAREIEPMMKYGSYKDHKTQSRRLNGTLDSELSGSLFSEPPPIGNWFSSYVYESPLLDTSDGLPFSLPREGEKVQEDVVTRGCRRETRQTTKLDKTNASTWEFEHEPVSCAKVADFSHSPSLLSEPPDIRNWFSSYTYESPQMYGSDELGYFSPEKDGLTIEESDTEGETNFGIIRKTRNKPGIISTERLESTGCKEIITASMDKKSSSERGNWGSVEGIQLVHHLEKKTSTGLLNGSTKGTKQEVTSGVKQDSRFNDESLLCEPKQKSSKSHGTSPCNLKPASSWNHEDSLREPKLQYLQEITTLNTRLESPRATQKVALDENVGATAIEVDDKENLYRGSTKTGFVTMKKDRFRGATKRNPKVKLDGGTLVECSRREELVMGMANEEDGEIMKRRKVLGETTNLNCSVTMEIPGKWCCPQKNKVNLGPPLKQLRLGTWFRRL